MTRRVAALAACGAASARRARRLRSQPLGVHARRPRSHDDVASQPCARASRRRARLHPASGVHPRLGRSMSFRSSRSASPTAGGAAIAVRARTATWWPTEFAVPVFFYDGRSDRERDLPHCVGRRSRRGARPRARRPHPHLGATAVGASRRSSRSTACSTTDDVRRRRHRATCASAMAGCRACGRSGSRCRARERAGLDERHRPRLAPAWRTACRPALAGTRAGPRWRGRARRAAAGRLEDALLTGVPRLERPRRRPHDRGPARGAVPRRSV